MVSEGMNQSLLVGQLRTGGTKGGLAGTIVPTAILIIHVIS